MPRPLRTAAAGVLVLALVLGAAACGGDDDKPAASSSSSGPSSSPPATPTDGAPNSPGSQLSPDPGLPSDFPAADIPLLSGPVTQPLGAGPPGEEGRKGWFVEVAVAKDREACFNEGAAALVGNGFTLAAGPDRSEAITEAQYVSSDYVVIISARAGSTGGCSLGYEVAQVSR